MKNATFIFLLSLFTNMIFAQHKYMNEEDKAIEEFKLLKQGNQNKSIGDISGFCDAFTTSTDQGVGIGWDNCGGNTWEGEISFEFIDGNLYNVYSVSPEGQTFNDLSFGAFYACYETESQNSMPNSDALNPTLFFNVDDFGQLSFSGSSQWGEVYSISNIEMDGAELNFNWTNDYGEGAMVRLERQDGQIWEDLLTPCVFDSESDSLALVAIYNACDGPNWNIPWNLNAPITEWYGVTIDPQICRVTELDMGLSAELIMLGFNDNNLSGEIPTEISNLTELTSIDFRNNQLEGEILPKIADLIKLEMVALSNNQFSGTIVPELSNLTNLEIFSISSNDMEGELPTEISTLPVLTTFFASNNTLEGEIPAEFGNFPSLRNLSMWGNNFSGSIPGELSNLEGLFNLTLDFNNLSGEIPASLGEIESLALLRLSFNQLSGSIPEGFPNLNILRLNNNDLSGEIPDNFITTIGVNEINLAYNNFTGPFPSRFILSDSFQELYFNNNDFTGCVENIDDLCFKPFNDVLDTVTINGVEYYASYLSGYNFQDNPKMAWEGATQNTCNGEDQIGAPCNDGDPNTTNDVIDVNCDCSQIVSVKDIAELNSISIAPNPLQAGSPIYMTFDLNENIEINMDVLDLQGKVIMNKNLKLSSGSNSVTLESDGLSSGLYFLQLSTKEGVTSHKFVVQ